MDAFRKLTALRDKKGIAVIYVAIVIFVLIIFVVLAVDIGYMYVAKAQLQNAADAAALAGAGRLDNPSDFTQPVARSEAKILGELNTVVPAGTLVTISNNNDGSNTLIDGSPGNDITVGNWDDTQNPKYSTTRQPVNAVQVRARRLANSPGGAVGLFFGRVFGWTQMDAAAQAIAVRSTLTTPGLSICVDTCSLVPTCPGGGVPSATPSCCDPSQPLNTTTAALILQKDQGPINNGIAWTSFGCTQAPNLGTNGDVVDRIWGRGGQLTTLCDLCITTNNGIGQALNQLENAFNSTTYDAANKKFNADGTVAAWTVAVPVLDYQCNASTPSPACVINPLGNVNTGNSACPPGRQGHTQELYHIQQIATLRITQVNNQGAAPQKGITIDCIKCIGCPTFIPFSAKGTKLVR